MLIIHINFKIETQQEHDKRTTFLKRYSVNLINLLIKAN